MAYNGLWQHKLAQRFLGPAAMSQSNSSRTNLRSLRNCLVKVNKLSKWVKTIPTQSNTAPSASIGQPSCCNTWGINWMGLRDISQDKSWKTLFNICQRFSKYTTQHKHTWLDAPTVLTILRATPTRATGISPFELKMGHVMRLPISLQMIWDHWRWPPQHIVLK